MANVDQNVVMRFNKGAFAKTVVYRTMNGKTFSCKYPDMSNVIPSRDQLKGRKRFSDAIRFAKAALKDPAKKAMYEEMGGHSAYHAAVKDYMNQFDAKKPVKIVQPPRIATVLESLGLDKPQLRAALYVEKNNMITNSVYQKMNDVSKATATRRLQELVDLKLIQSNGVKGAGAHYIIGSWWEEQWAQFHESIAKIGSKL